MSAKKPTKPKGKAKPKPAPAKKPRARASRSVAQVAAPPKKRNIVRTIQPSPEAIAAKRLELTTQICDMYSSGRYTLESCCNEAGISYSEFWRWRLDDSGLKALFEKAVDLYRKARFEGLRELSLNSFEKLVAGFEFEETVTEGQPRTDSEGKVVGTAITKVKKTKGHVAPNPGMVAMAMKNLHGFTDGASVNVGVNVGGQGVFVIGGKEFEF